MSKTGMPDFEDRLRLFASQEFPSFGAASAGARRLRRDHLRAATSGSRCPPVRGRPW